MSDPAKAVFLSYASQDAEAAKKICDALRAGGVEVWFDADGGLEHGDEWDAKIRRQIKECVLFIPIISAATQARHEGYFRIEWELAAQRAMGIASGVPFILPVVIDGTREPEALVPDRFRAVQWTRLPGGVVPPDVLARFLKLWSHRTGVIAHEARSNVAGLAEAGPGSATPATVASRSKVGFKNYALIALVVIFMGGAIGWWTLHRSPSAEGPAPVAITATPASEADQLVRQARELVYEPDSARNEFALAEDLLKRAIGLTPGSGAAWGVSALVNQSFFSRGYDLDRQRLVRSQADAEKALLLDPRNVDALLALALHFQALGETNRAQDFLDRARAGDPQNNRVIVAQAYQLSDPQARVKFLLDAADQAAKPAQLLYYAADVLTRPLRRYEEAWAISERALAAQPFWRVFVQRADLEELRTADPAKMTAWLEKVPEPKRDEQRVVYMYFEAARLRRDGPAAVRVLTAFAADYFEDHYFTGPKAYLLAEAYELAGQPTQAFEQWQLAEHTVREKLATDPYIPYARPALAVILAAEHRVEEAKAMAEASATDDRLQDLEFAREILAKAFVRLGEPARAIAMLRGNRPDNFNGMFSTAMLAADPNWTSLHDQPDYPLLLEEVRRAENSDAAANNPAPTEGAQLTARALALIEKVGFTRDDLGPAEDFARRATEKEPDSAAAWGVRAAVQSAWLSRNWDTSEKRLQETQALANRALALDPNEPEAQLALGHVLRRQGADDQAIALLRRASDTHPDHVRLSRALGFILGQAGREAEGRAVLLATVKRTPNDPLLRYELATTYGVWGHGGALPENAAASLEQLDAALALEPFSAALLLKAVLIGGWRGDLAAMRAVLDQEDKLPLADRADDRAVCVQMWAGLMEHRPDRVEAAAALTARNYIEDSLMPLHPKAWWLAQAHRLAGKVNSARADWQAAEAVMRQRIKDDPDNLRYQVELATTLAWLDQRDEAIRIVAAVEPVWKENLKYHGSRWLARYYAALGDAKQAAPYLAEIIDSSPFESRKIIPLDPWWDKLRGLPEFEAILKEPEAKK